MKMVPHEFVCSEYDRSEILVTSDGLDCRIVVLVGEDSGAPLEKRWGVLLKLLSL